MILLNANNLNKTFVDQTLFSGVSFSIDERDKIGFIGANGAGKSTLFKIIAGLMDSDGGEIYKSKLTKIGYLEQHACTDPNRTIMEEILSGFGELCQIEAQLEDIRYDIDRQSGDLDMLIRRQTVLTDRYEELGGYVYKSLIRSSLIGLGFSENDFTMPVRELSGGQKTRVSLCRLLLSDANLLLLDEPTNHLDIESVEWLEGFLQSWSGSFIIISHDRYFLDRVTNRTFELGGGQLRTYTGGYSEYLKQREVERKTEERSYTNTMRQIQRLEGIVEQQRRWNREKNIKTAQSKEKIIEKLEDSLQLPQKERGDISFSFKAAPGGGQDVLITDDLGVSFGYKSIFNNCSTHIVKGERVFLLGANGCGKTTYIKTILGKYSPDSGSVTIGANIKTGYYDQIQENLSLDKTVFDELHDEYPNMTETQLRNALAVFLFRGDDVFKEINKLSGGERARVELVKLMLTPVNFLIMDEPTNHLDIDSREALENALSGYEGTMLIVSHDRYFINKLADRIIYMTESGFRNFIGGYDDFIESRQRLGETNAASVSTEKPKNADYSEQKRRQSEKRRVLSRFEKVEQLIDELEMSITRINEEMAMPEYASDFTRLGELSSEADKMNNELDSLMNEWEKLQSEIEEKGY